MPQIARPLADVSKGLWTPTPVFAAIDEMNEAGADATFVTSGNVAGDSFEVDLASMAYANSLPQTLKVRLRKTTADNNQVTLTLFEGTTMVAYRVIPGSQITQTFTTKTFPLTYSEISNISDYTDIRLKVTAGFATNTNCSLNPAGVPNTWRVAFSGIFAGTCVDCNVLNRPWDMPVIGPCHWSNSYQPYKNFCGNNDLTLDLGPAGNLVVLVIYKGNTVIAQYQQTLAAWHWLSSNTTNRGGGLIQNDGNDDRIGPAQADGEGFRAVGWPGHAREHYLKILAIGRGARDIGGIFCRSSIDLAVHNACWRAPGVVEVVRFRAC